MDEILFTTPQVAGLLGIKTRKAIAFIDRGYIQHTATDAGGHGTKRQWNRADIVVCAIINTLDKVLTADGIRYISQLLHDRSKIVADATITVVFALGDDRMDIEDFIGLEGGISDGAEIADVQDRFEAYSKLGIYYSSSTSKGSNSPSGPVKISIRLGDVIDWVDIQIKEIT
jgi:hypothetical protein